MKRICRPCRLAIPSRRITPQLLHYGRDLRISPPLFTLLGPYAKPPSPLPVFWRGHGRFLVRASELRGTAGAERVAPAHLSERRDVDRDESQDGRSEVGRVERDRA